MDFFAAQEHARRQTKWLIFYYGLALLFMVVGIYVVALALFGFATSDDGKLASEFRFWNPALFVIVLVANVIVVGFASLMKIGELSSGGEHIAAVMGGVRVPPTTTDFQERKLLNVVEEMALAAGVSVPPVYVMNDEHSINAFAAGFAPADAVIGVNRGTIEQLNRDELQGVIAHEFSHILNGDMRMNIRLIGILYGIQMLAMIGYFMMRVSGGSRHRSSGNDKSGTAAILVLGLGVLVFGAIGQFFARLIKASISRQREFLADASAVQFTRYPEGIAGALKMIGATTGSAIESPEAESLSHMYFASCFTSRLFEAFATHPPLPKRIVKLDSSFDGDFKGYLHVRQLMAQRREEAESKSRAKREEFKEALGGIIFPTEIAERFSIDPMILIAAIGEPTREDVEYSQSLVKQIPRHLFDAAHDTFTGRCVAFATLLDDDESLQAAQIELIAKGEGEPTAEETRKLAPMVSQLDLALRLPLMEILQSSLSNLSTQQYKRFRATVIGLVKSDGKITIYEFVVRHHLLMHLDRRLLQTPPAKIRFNSCKQLEEEIELLLSAFASVGETDPATTEAGYHVALKSIGLRGEDDDIILLQWEIAQLDKSLKRLALGSPQLKKSFLQAAAVLITYDHEITVAEAELFRAVAESLDCPVPAFVAGKTKQIKS